MPLLSTGVLRRIGAVVRDAETGRHGHDFRRQRRRSAVFSAGGGEESGCRLTLNSTTTVNASSSQVITWSNTADWEVGETDYFDSGQPTRLVIPAAYDTKQMLFTWWVKLQYHSVTPTVPSDQRITLKQGGSALLDPACNPHYWGDGMSGYDVVFNGCYPVRNADDYYELEVFNNDASNSIDIVSAKFALLASSLTGG